MEKGQPESSLIKDHSIHITYILQSVADDADLPTLENEVLSVSTFAKKQSEEIPSQLKMVEVCRGNFKLKMLCNTVKTICVPLQTAPLKEENLNEVMKFTILNLQPRKF